uniref:Ras association domain family member 3 n=1 Tax=Hucho hucho TaxID=62062 RepID=A0A4W5R3H0_9TELE
MSSGYSSLEEDSEEYFFTARTSFFKKPSGKPAQCKDVEQERELRTHLSRQEIRQKVELYNSSSKDHLKMTLASDQKDPTGFSTVYSSSLCLGLLCPPPPTLPLVCVGVFPPVVYMCKLSEGEHPLFLRLLAGPNTDTLGFVLREQQTGEWDAFSVPELSNFLRMLEKEETERVCSVTRRYDSYRLKLQEAMRAAGEPG